MKSSNIVGRLACCFILLPSFALKADISGSVALTSDYLFKGGSLSNQNPALQPFVEYGFENGAYTSAWASNVDFRATNAQGQSVKHTSAELDLAVGYRWQANDNIALDAGFVSYSYFGGSRVRLADNSVVSAADGNYEEVYLQATVNGNTHVGYWFSPGFYDSNDNHSIFLLSHSWSMPAELTFQVTANYVVNHNNDTAYQRGTSDHYTHLALALSGEALKLGWTLGLETQSNNNSFGSKIRPVVMLSYAF